MMAMATPIQKKNCNKPNIKVWKFLTQQKIKHSILKLLLPFGAKQQAISKSYVEPSFSSLSALSPCYQFTWLQHSP